MGECIAWYVAWFGQWVPGGTFASVGWLMAKIAENCG